MGDGRLEAVLAAQPRRFLRALRDDTSRDADPIVRPGETLECEEYVTLCYELHHVILPEMAAAGRVEFDRTEDTVTRGTNFEDRRPPVERTVTDRGASDPGRDRRE